MYYAAMAGVSVAAPGACGTQACNKNNDCAEGFYGLREQGICGATGTCTLKHEACILIYAPVCGCDGKTDGNVCLAANAGVSVASVGPCPEKHCATNNDCAFGTFCLKKAGDCDGNGRCEACPSSAP